MHTGCDSSSQPNVLRLATTTSTRDSGLLEAILPQFELEQHVRVDVIAVGTGKALKLGEMGDVDLVLSHAREAEEAFMAAGHGIRREAVMYNTFEILGPANDPAGIKGLTAADALQKIAETNATFVSRGDDSGTHKREVVLWESQGGRPAWQQYRETGQGMGATLVIASELSAYVLADRGTYLKFRGKIELLPLAAQSSDMHNPYSIMVVNPDKHPAIRVKLAEAFADFLLLPSTQQQISNFQVDGESLFVPLHPPNAK